MEVQYQFIMLQTPSAFRFYVSDRRLVNDVIHNFLKSVTVWQDHNIKYGSLNWKGYECLPGVNTHIKGLLEKHFGAEDVTEKYISDCIDSGIDEMQDSFFDKEMEEMRDELIQRDWDDYESIKF